MTIAKLSIAGKIQAVKHRMAGETPVCEVSVCKKRYANDHLPFVRFEGDTAATLRRCIQTWMREAKPREIEDAVGSILTALQQTRGATAAVEAERDRAIAALTDLAAKFETSCSENMRQFEENKSLRAEVAALKNRKVELPLMFGEPDRGTPPDMAHGWKMYDDAVEACTAAIRAAGVEVVFAPHRASNQGGQPAATEPAQHDGRGPLGCDGLLGADAGSERKP